MAHGKKYNIVRDITTNKYYVCKNNRPIGCEWISFNKIKKLNLKFLEIPDIVKLFSHNYHTYFRGFIPIEIHPSLIENINKKEKHVRFTDDLNTNGLKRIRSFKDLLNL